MFAQQGDSILTVFVPQLAGTDWVAIASVVVTFIMTAAFVGITWYYGYRMHQLQIENNTLQKRWHDERIAADRLAASMDQRATDFRIGGIAYALARQIRSWLDQSPAEKPLRHLINTLVAMEDIHDSARYEPMGLLVDWANEHGGPHQNRAEERIEALVTFSPEASPEIVRAVTNATALFYTAMGRINRQVREYRRAMDAASASQFLSAYEELDQCLGELDKVIPHELRTARRELTGEDTFRVAALAGTSSTTGPRLLGHLSNSQEEEGETDEDSDSTTGTAPT